MDLRKTPPFLLTLLGSVLLWAALPPLWIAPLAWVAPVPWLILVQSDTLGGRRPYRAIYFGALLFWLASIHWIRLPHPALYVGWLALSAYLACYLPVFVGLCRVAVHRLSIPLWIAAPVVWTGLELARAHIMTGFLMGSIAHSQAKWPKLIQMSELAGEYGVTFLILLVAASITAAFYPKFRPAGLIPGAAALAVAIWYGASRVDSMADAERAQMDAKTIRIALIQGNSLADWKSDAAKQREIMEEYVSLSEKAVAQATEAEGSPLDLVVWPETMFRSGLVSYDAGYQLPEGSGRTIEELSSYGPTDLARLTRRLGTPVLVGIDRVHFLADAGGPDTAPSRYRGYNSSAFVTPDGKVLGTYDKQHLVMFGEYVPFARWFPVLDRLSSVTGSVEAGVEPVAFEHDGVFYAPNICYETAIPHVIRRQVKTLDSQDRQPDVLVNLTNDAWYWGSSELDMHLACGIYRAVETRTPLVIAANGGISAWIDDRGQVRAESPRQQSDVIIADVNVPAGRGAPTHYVAYGDWFSGICLLAVAGLAVFAWHDRRRPRDSLDGSST